MVHLKRNDMKIISGGQTGIDRLGLETARACGLPTGGYAPKDYRTENGPDPSLRQFGLIETASSSCTPRTIANIRASDGTVLFGDTTSRGSADTIKFCIAHRRPYIENPTAHQLLEFIYAHNIRVLNVAGNRASRLSTNQLTYYRAILLSTLRQLHRHQ
jgi:hypothetical protein